MPTGEAPGQAWTVDPEHDGVALAAFLRACLPGKSWNQIKNLVATGKVFVDGERAAREGRRLQTGQRVELRMAAPRPRSPRTEARIVFEDAHVIVIDKPAGVSSVPYETREAGTAIACATPGGGSAGRPRAPRSTSCTGSTRTPRG